MRARWLKPEFFTDKKIASMGPIVALVYQALWCMADDGGTAQCDADTVKAQMFYRWSAVGVPEISEALTQLSACGRIVRYVVGDDTYCTVERWKEHQKVHKPSAFRYPTIAQGVAIAVPEECGNSAALVGKSPPPRHLDTKTPRHLDTPVAEKRATWLTPFAGVWGDKFGGKMPIGPAAKELKPLVDEHGAEEVLRRWRNYIAVATAEHVNPARFASTFGRWNNATTAIPNTIRPTKSEQRMSVLAEFATEDTNGQ